MTEATVIELLRELGTIVLTLSGPLLSVGLLVGLSVSVVQVVTSIHDPTLSFVPRILIVMFVGLLLMSWMLEKVTSYTSQLFSQLAKFAG